MTTTTPMLQTFKKKQSKSSSSTFLYQLYECVQLLAVNKNNHKISEQKGFQGMWYASVQVSLYIIIQGIIISSK